MLRDDSVALVSVYLEMNPLKLGMADDNLELSIRSEAHARFPADLDVDPALNEGADNAFCETQFFVESSVSDTIYFQSRCH
jgi:hypothetical protein